MSKLFIEDTSLTAIGDAIREKTGKEDLIKLGDMPAEIASITTGGDTSMEDGLITKTLSYYRNDRVTELKSYNFYQYPIPISLAFPNVTTVASFTFMSANNIIKLDFGKLTTLNSQYFLYTNRNFEALILRSPTLCTLGSIGVFNTDGIANGTGYIYVPKALIEDYKVATNWVNYANQFRAIEDYPEICGGAE